MPNTMSDTVIIMDWELMFAGPWLYPGSKKPQDRGLSMRYIWPEFAMIEEKAWMKTPIKLWNGIAKRPNWEALKLNTVSADAMNTARA